MPYEALSLVDGIDTLASLLRGGAPERELAWRVLEVTAGNPVALRRLGDLAREGRPALEKAFEGMPAARSPGAGSQPAVAPDAPHREEHAPPPVLSMRPVTRQDRGTAPSMSTPEEVSERAVALLLEKLSPEERNLLWRLSRAPAPAAVNLIKRVAESPR
jgi:hypothetical protein